MAELKLMIERISEREKNVIRNKLATVEKKAELEIKSARKEADEKLESEKERILKEFDYEFSMKENTEDVNYRNAILREKQKVIQRAFKDSLMKLNEISTEDFMKIVATALENVDVTQSVSLFLGERTNYLFDNEWLGNHLPWNHHVRVEKDVVKNKTGILVRRDNIDYNYFFEELIKEHQQELLPHLTNELFNNEK